MASKWVLPFLCLSLLVFPVTAASALDRSDANSVWVAETEGSIRLSSTDGSIRAEISGFTNVRAAALDVRRETLWLLADRELHAFELSGALRFSVPVAMPDSVQADLAVVPSTGDLWLGVNKHLVNVGSDGQMLGTFELPGNALVLAVDEGESILWAGTDGSVQARDLVTGAAVGEITLARGERLEDLAIEPAGGRLWIAAGDQARLVERSGEVVLERRLKGLRRIAPGPGGVIWLAGLKEVARLLPDGAPEPAFEPLGGRGTLEHLVVSGDGTVWVTTQTAVARVSEDGSLIDRIAFDPPIRIWDIATNTDWIPPTVEIRAPAAHACIADSTPSIELAFSDQGWGVVPTSLEVLADSIPVVNTCSTAPESATCQVLAPLAEGEVLLGARVADYAGNEAEAPGRPVVIDTLPPQIFVSAPPDGTTVAKPEALVSGSLSEPAELTVAGAPVVLSADLAFTDVPVALEEGANEIDLRAVDCAGNVARRTLTVSYDPDSSGELPPDPSTVAPPLDPTVPTDMWEATRFLYEGPTPVQLEVEPGAIAPTRVSVVRGRVVARSGEPLPGVRIEVFGDPELGHTQSREDGAFDLAVNGGARVTLAYSKPGYLPTHRPVQATWRDFAAAEEVVLLPYDDQATVVSMAAAEVQVARGSVSSDADGNRQAVVMVPAGTGAELVLPDGSRLPVQSLTLRATEYTVGPLGPQAMPAPLPPTSGYTYAVELSADEAVAAGATSVVFDEPVFLHVENFLGFPVGTAVPAGSYDRASGVWVPSENGRVIRVLDVVGGRAVLDVDGSGNPAAGSELDSLGVTDGELARLAELYGPGQSLWRTPIPHLTPWDCNWPYGPPEDAEEPPEPDAEEPDPDDPETDEVQDDDEPAEDEDHPACETGSVIECENQILGEQIPLVGTSQALHYRSSRVPGRRVADRMKVRLSGRSVPASLRRIELRIDIAGRRFSRTFAPAPNQTFTFAWDRIDAYGRPVQGRQPATAHVGYVYDAVYYEPADLAASFSAVSSGTRVSGDRSALEITLWRSARKMLGRADATMAGLGGWTLSDHHVYQPGVGSREMYYGSGEQEVGDELASFEAVWEAATDPTGFPDRPVLGPFGLAAAPDGGFYSIDLLPQGIAAPIWRVWKIAEDGQKQGAVFVIRSNNLPQVQVGPDGDVYIATCTGFASGEIQNLRTGESWSSFGTGCFDKFLVAPDGSFYYGRFELLHRRRDGRTSPVFSSPVLQELGFRTIDAQGRIYVGVWSTHRVWRVDPDGSAQVVAGTGMRGFAGDGGPATLALLDFPEELAIAPDGSLLIVDAGNRRVRLVSLSGTIHTIVGSGERSLSTGPVPPLAAGLRFPTYLAATPDGRVLVGDQPGQTGAILELGFPLPRYTPIGETTVASRNGDEVYVFDSRGRHLRTLNALTGAVERTLDYDDAGRLASITDAFGNVTRVERNGAGDPTAIVAPYGQRTELTLDGEGFLASVTNPAGESDRFEYAEGGLLRSLTDPVGHEKTAEYSALGRLVAVRDTAGGSKSLSRWTGGPGRHRVELTTAEGRETSYSLERSMAGSVSRATSTAAGTTLLTTELADGSRVVELPSGTVVRTVEGADPRFGLAAPAVSSREVTTPSGLSMRASIHQVDTLSEAGNPFSLASSRVNWSVNGRAGSEVFDAAARELTTTSPMGRVAVTVLDESSRPVAIRTPEVEEIRYQYDARGRLTQVAQGEGEGERVLALSYDTRGRLESVLDPLGREVQLGYDAANRVIGQTRPAGPEIGFGYDANGNLTSVVPPGRPPHRFRYTPADSVAAYEPPELGSGPATTNYSYSRDRKLVGISRPDGTSVHVTRDAAGRVTTVAHPAATLDLVYDPEAGHLSSIGAAETTVSYSYDGHLLAEATWTGAVEGSVKRSYDDNFWIRSQSVNGSQVTFDYDDDGLLTRAGALAVTRGPATGRIVGTAIGSIGTRASYNPFGELESLAAETADIPLYSVSFARDRLGRVATKTETIVGVTQVYDYSYDPTGKLEAVTRNGSLVEAYRYDENGNRLAAIYPWGEVNGAYDAQDRLRSYGTAAYTYTATGELATRTDGGATTLFDYDVFGNLRQVDLPTADVIEYVIDGRNRRIGRKVNGVLVQGFLYQDALNPVAELDGTGTPVSRFVYGTRANVPDFMIKGATTYRLISNHLGSVRLVVDVETGAIAQQLDYDAFGRVVLDTAPGFQPFGFAGGLYDPLTGLVRFGARDYDPQVGRWTTRDPVLFAGGKSSLYCYVFNDPVNWLDPTGLESRPEGYATVGIALVEALGEITQKSLDELGWEWGGVIYKQPDGEYNYTGPVTERDPFRTRFPGGPSDCQDVATYHNHPSHPEAVDPESFSPADEALAEQGLDMYLLTPSNTLFKMAPTGEVTRIGRMPTGGD